MRQDDQTEDQKQLDEEARELALRIRAGEPPKNVKLGVNIAARYESDRKKYPDVSEAERVIAVAAQTGTEVVGKIVGAEIGAAACLVAGPAGLPYVPVASLVGAEAAKPVAKKAGEKVNAVVHEMAAEGRKPLEPKLNPSGGNPFAFLMPSVFMHASAAEDEKMPTKPEHGSEEHINQLYEEYYRSIGETHDTEQPETESEFHFAGLFFESDVQVNPLFRGDGRAPEEIFSKGFTARGTNPNLEQHIYPGDAFSKDSAYISTTTEKKIGESYTATAVVNSKKKGKAYLYEINPQKNGIDAGKIVGGWASSEKEIAVPFKIEGKDIKGAWLYERNGKIAQGEYIPNPDYVPSFSPSLVKAAKALKTVGHAVTAVGVFVDGRSLYLAYQQGVRENDHRCLVNETTRVAGGWSGAISVGARCAKAGLICGARVGPWSSLAGSVIGGIVGSVAGYHGGSAAAVKLKEWVAETVKERGVSILLDVLPRPATLYAESGESTKSQLTKKHTKATTTATTTDSISDYQSLLASTIATGKQFYQTGAAMQKPTSKKATPEVSELQRQAKERRERAREINLDNIRAQIKLHNIQITNAATTELNKKALEAQHKLEEAIRSKKASDAEIKKYTHDFLQSTAAFGDAISKNLASAGFKTASRVLSTVSNGLSAGLAAHAMGAALKGAGFKVLGAAAGPIGIGIAAITTIMGLLGDDSSSQSNGLSELAAHMDGRFDRVESLIEKSTDLIRHDIRVLLQVMLQISEKINRLSEICTETLRCLYDLNRFVREEAIVTADKIDFIQTKSLEDAQLTLSEYWVFGDKKLPDNSVFIELKNWLLQHLHSPVMTGANCASLSSERVAQMLAMQFAKNAEKELVMPGFLAARLHQHFPHLNFNQFASLPSMPLFTELSDLYLKALEKAGKTTPEDYVSVCTKTKATLKLYAEFIDTLKKNPDVIQALFDQYAFYQRKNDKQYQPMMAEIKGLLQNIVPLLEDKQFEDKLLVLDQPVKVSAIKVSGNSAKNPMELWRSIQSLPESERVKQLWEFFDMQDNNPMTHAAKGIHHRLDGLKDHSQPDQPIMWFLPIEEKVLLDAMPKSVVFRSNCDGDILADGQGYRVLGQYHYRPGDTIQFGTAPYHNKPGIGIFYTESMLLLSLACRYTHISLFTQKFKVPRLYQPYQKHNDRHNLRKLLATQYFVCDYQGATNIREFYDTLPDTLPKEYEAILASAESGFFAPKKLEYALYYIALSSAGDHFGARAFALKNPKNPIDPYSLLFLTAIIGRFDIFESYAKQFPLPADFNFEATAEGGTLTPLAFAKRLGHQEVIDALSDIPALKVRLAGVRLTPETTLELQLKNQIAEIVDFETAYAPTESDGQSETASDASESSDSDDESVNDDWVTVNGEEELLNEELEECGRPDIEVEKTNKHGERTISASYFETPLAKQRFFKALKRERPAISCRDNANGIEEIVVPLETKPVARF